jgi:anti-sigma factor RsiW
MSSLQIHHPEDDLLLRYIDGELPSRRVRQVTHHLEACWQCRSEVEELQGTIADCVRYRKNVLETHLPPPPNPWPDMYREFARVDTALSAEPWMARVKRSLGSPLILRWGIAVAAAIVVAVVVFQQFREAPTVQAAALLKRAVSAADARQGTPRHILIQTRTQRMTRVIGSRQTRAAVEPLAATLKARFQAAHYDWDDPLSAKAYKGWFDGLAPAARRDEVTTVADPQLPAERCYQIRTEASEGNVAAASLTLRATDLRPVEGKLEFRDREWVEFTEITEATTRDDGRPVATNVEPPIGGAVPSRLARTPGPTASISDELQVLAALHEIGADLGDPVEVTLSGERVVVNGVGIPAQRQKQIHDALDAIPHVEIQFTEPAAAPLPAAPAVPDAGSGGSKPAGIQARVEQQVGGRAEFERFSAQILDRNEMMMSHAYALRALAQRFPADQGAGLSPQDRQVLRDMARDDAGELSKQASGLERALNPLLTAMGGSAAMRAAATQSAWEPAAEELFQASHRVEVLVSVMLGATRGDGATDHLPSELLSAIRELRADLDRCQQLLGLP